MMKTCGTGNEEEICACRAITRHLQNLRNEVSHAHLAEAEALGGIIASLWALADSCGDLDPTAGVSLRHDTAGRALNIQAQTGLEAGCS
jgi:hypothetical protein